MSHIELPPLPEQDAVPVFLPSYSEASMRAYALACVEAERDRVEALRTADVNFTPDTAKLVSLWFDEWELILPPEARESFRNDLMPSIAGVQPSFVGSHIDTMEIQPPPRGKTRPAKVTRHGDGVKGEK